MHAKDTGLKDVDTWFSMKQVVVIGGCKSVFWCHTGMARARDVQVGEPKHWSPLMVGHVKFYLCSEGHGFIV